MQFKFNSSTNQITAKCCLLLLFLFLSLYQLACAQEEQRHDSLPFPVRERNAATDDQSLTAWSLIVSAALTAQIYSQPDEYWQTLVSGALIGDKSPENLQLELLYFKLRGHATDDEADASFVNSWKPQIFLVDSYNEDGRFDLDVDLHFSSLDTAVKVKRFGSWRLQNLRIGVKFSLFMGDSLEDMSVQLRDVRRLDYRLTMLGSRNGVGGFFRKIWERMVRAVIKRATKVLLNKLKEEPIPIGKKENEEKDLFDYISEYHAILNEAELVEKAYHQHSNVVRTVRQKVLDSIVGMNEMIDETIEELDERLLSMSASEEVIEEAQDITCNSTSLLARLIVDPVEANRTFTEEHMNAMERTVPALLRRPGGKLQMDEKLQNLMAVGNFEALERSMRGWNEILKRLIYAAAFNPKEQKQMLWNAALALDSTHVEGASWNFQRLSLGIDSHADMPDIIMAPVQPEEPYTFALDMQWHLSKFEMVISIHVLGIPVHVTVTNLRIKGELSVRILPEFYVTRDFAVIWFEEDPFIDFSFRFTGSDHVSNFVHKKLDKAILKMVRQKLVYPQMMNIPLYSKAEKTVTALRGATENMQVGLATNNVFFNSVKRKVKEVDEQFLCVLSQIRYQAVDAMNDIIRAASPAALLVPSAATIVVTFMFVLLA